MVTSNENVELDQECILETSFKAVVEMPQRESKSPLLVH